MLTGHPCPFQAKKQERCAVDVSASFDDADAAAEGVRLRVEMQRAVDEERCGESVARLQPARRASSFSVPCIPREKFWWNKTLPCWQERLGVCRCESGEACLQVVDVLKSCGDQGASSRASGWHGV